MKIKMGKNFLLTYLITLVLCVVDIILYLTLSLCKIVDFTWMRLSFLFAGILCVLAPLLIEKIFKVKTNFVVLMLYEIFILFSIYVGSVWDIYSIVPFYDIIMHTFSGAIIPLIAYMFFCSSKKNTTSLVWLFIVVFSFSIMCGALWEIWEFTTDGIFGNNSQRFIGSNGEELVGRLALMDTMIDIVCDVVGSLIGAVLAVVIHKQKIKKDLSFKEQSIENKTFTESTDNNIEK